MSLKSTFILFLSIAVIGCADPKAANENNFKLSIQAYLDTTYPRCYLNTQFPASIEWDVSGLKGKLQALAKAGLVLETKAPLQKPSFSFGKGGDRLVPTFDLTEEGRKYYKADAVKNIRGEALGGFCFGKARVKEVTQFTEPSDMFGQKITRVNYTYEVYDLPDWAKAPEVNSEIDTLKADAESDKTPINALDVLILTNNGWVHEKLFKQQAH